MADPRFAYLPPAPPQAVTIAPAFYDSPMRSLLVAGLLVLVACAPPEPLRGIDLPPASLPDEIDSAQWAVAFSHDFGPAFWGEGPHVYQLVLDCPEIEEATVESEFIAFVAGSDIPIQGSPVHLRLSGLSTTAMGPPDLQFVSTEQETTALLTAVGLSANEMEAAERCVGEIRWDDGQSATLAPGEPFRP